MVTQELNFLKKVVKFAGKIGIDLMLVFRIFFCTILSFQDMIDFVYVLL